MGTTIIMNKINDLKNMCTLYTMYNTCIHTYKQADLRHTDMHTYIQTHIHIHVIIYKIHSDTHTHTYVYIHTYIHTYTHKYIYNIHSDTYCI